MYCITLQSAQTFSRLPTEAYLQSICLHMPTASAVHAHKHLAFAHALCYSSAACIISPQALLGGARGHAYWPLLQVGRPRPNFAERCWPGGQTPEYNDAGIPLCSSNSVDPAEGRKSFPSGHTPAEICNTLYDWGHAVKSCIATELLCDLQLMHHSCWQVNVSCVLCM